nr:MAG TPA: hypothetical protein [Caudoviricetes sp.]
MLEFIIPRGNLISLIYFIEVTLFTFDVVVVLIL